MIAVKTRDLKTEDLGKIFEKAICLSYGIPYNGRYKYSVEEAEKLVPRLVRLGELFAPLCEHTAYGGARYDFSAIGCDRKLSAKTSKLRAGKVAPQEIGQPQPQKFCDKLGIPYVGVPELKKYIQENVASVLPILVEHTFDCDNLYYNKALGVIKFVRLLKPIDWSAFTYVWTKDWTTWSNSSTVKIVIGDKRVPLVEFQFHSKSRTNMAIRWCYDEFLAQFADHLSITDL